MLYYLSFGLISPGFNYCDFIRDLMSVKQSVPLILKFMFKLVIFMTYLFSQMNSRIIF